MEIKKYEFKDATVDGAIEKGLKELGLEREEVDVEVKSYGGIFSKATVEIIVKEEEATNEPLVSEELPVTSPVTEDELVEAENLAGEFVTALVAKMGINCAVEVNRKGEEIFVNITGEDAGVIIGYRGEVLDAIQYFTLWITNKCGKDFVRVTLDAENYRKKRCETLQNLAFRLAKKCSRTNRKVELEPMNPFERRVIHTALQDNKYVTTTSEGEGRFRHVVISPKETATKTASEAREMTYGTSSSFKRKGAVKTRSFGGNKRKF